MAILLILAGLLIWLLTTMDTLGIILLVLGIILLFVPQVPYGYHSWGGRGRP
jgi:hypothetical protein